MKLVLNLKIFFNVSCDCTTSFNSWNLFLFVLLSIISLISFMILSISFPIFSLLKTELSQGLSSSLCYSQQPVLIHVQFTFLTTFLIATDFNDASLILNWRKFHKGILDVKHFVALSRGHQEELNTTKVYLHHTVTHWQSRLPIQPNIYRTIINCRTLLNYW